MAVRWRCDGGYFPPAKGGVLEPDSKTRHREGSVPITVPLPTNDETRYRQASRSIVVTGAGGLIGAPLVGALADNGYRVVAIDDGSAGTLHRLARVGELPSVDTRVLDICDRAALTRLIALERPWGLVHLAARHFIPDCERAPATTLKVNVLGTQYVIDACRQAPPERMLFASTADVYALNDHPHSEDAETGPHGVYGWSKLLGERLLLEQAHRLGDCDVVIARLFNVYGPGDPHPHLVPEILRQARSGSTLRLGDLDAIRDFVFVDDAVTALVTLLERGHGVVNVGTGIATRARELIDQAAAATGRPLRTRVGRERLRRCPRQVSVAVSDRLCELLPNWPMTSLPDGVRRTVEATDDAHAGTDRDGLVS